jgi:hypothetical protein
MSKTKFSIWMLLVVLGFQARASEVLVEAESFQQRGGWQLDTQFIRQMGSPYLLAHGLGTPVADATTKVKITSDGEYTVWVRTYDWVARWKAPGTPGRFAVSVDGKKLEKELGTEGENWDWHRVGVTKLKEGEVELRLHDLVGFDGRCDAIYLTTDKQAMPDNSSEILSAWRCKLLGIREPVEVRNEYDLVVVGGGYAGMGAAISAARMGCKVALIQDRGVLGGNGSSEVRVWAMGLIRRGKFPRIGEIVEEFSDSATKSPGSAEMFGEKNIDLFLNHHAFRASKDGDKVKSVDAIDTLTSQLRRFESPLFVDCTGHGTIGFLVEADWEMTPQGRMGMSNMWTWDEVDGAKDFPDTPWALQMNMADFPYPRDHHGQWFWESGFDKDPIKDAEGIRDWNLRAVFGAFNTMKNGDGSADHKKAILTWVAYVGGPRESRRLMGDVVLTQEDVVTKREFPDGCVPSTWSIDLHYPKKEFAKKFEENPFISIAEHDQRIDRNYGYPVPYRCFYSRNVNNLFMAGRCVSVTHEALGTVRVMKTCGMMGEVVGKAASLCRQHDCMPRDVYESHLSELTQLLELPGKARRATIGGVTDIPADALPLAGKYGVPTGLDPASMAGVVIDNRDAKSEGTWTSGAGLKGYVAYDYVYASADSGAKITFSWKADKDMRAEIRLAYQPHENRGRNVPVAIVAGTKRQELRINMQLKAPIKDAFVSLGEFNIKNGDEISIVVSTEAAGGLAHADAVHILPIK